MAVLQKSKHCENKCSPNGEGSCCGSIKSEEFAGPTNANNPKRARNARPRRPRFRFKRNMKTEGTNYDLITSMDYLTEKYGIKKTHYIEKFLKCIHKKMDHGVNKISDKYIGSLNPWVKIKFFLLLVTLAQRGGPEYWMDKNEQDRDSSAALRLRQQQEERKGNGNVQSSYFSLTEHIMRQNINHDFTERVYDENYVFSSIWANFMEGLINHYLEQIIVPRSEMKVCQQLYKPMMKIISLYNEYNELMEKSERNGFLSAATEESREEKLITISSKATSVVEELDDHEDKDKVTQERLQRAQKLLWQARQDIPKTISKELTLLSEMYSTLSADEQDYELDEFVCCAEEYIELEYLPSLIDVLFANCGTVYFWKIMVVLEPFFYYIEDVGDDVIETDDEREEEHSNASGLTTQDDLEEGEQRFKPDQRVVILEKICEVAARQKWI